MEMSVFFLSLFCCMLKGDSRHDIGRFMYKGLYIVNGGHNYIKLLPFVFGVKFMTHFFLSLLFSLQHVVCD